MSLKSNTTSQYGDLMRRDSQQEEKKAFRSNQNNGDLFVFLEELKQYLPTGYGLMSVREVLSHLMANAAPIFKKLDFFCISANSAAILSDAMAEEWKAKGNDAFNDDHWEEAVQNYSRGILCAESEEVLSTLISNRSTAFYKMNRFLDAFDDAHYCVTKRRNYWKTLFRRGCALQKLGFTEQGDRDVKAAEARDESLSNTPEELKPVIRNSGMRMAACSIPTRSHLDSRVKIKQSAESCHLVAAEKLEGGTGILEETPCACVVRLENLLCTCSFCLQYTICLYHSEEFRAAGKKSRGLFCSEECGSSAWKYYGASETGNIFFLCCPNDALLAHHLLQSKEEHVLENDLPTREKIITPLGRGTNSSDTFQSSFSRELNPVESAGGYETLVSALGLYMGAFTDGIAELMRNAQRQILQCAIDVTCHLRVRRNTDAGCTPSAREIFSTTTVSVGRAVYPIGSILKHSCDPNCFLSFEENPQGCCAKMAVRVIRQVMPNEELTVAYGGLTRFQSHSKKNRIKLLEKRYGFICRCDACINDVDEIIPASDMEHYIKAADYYQKGCRLIREKQYTTAITVLLQSYEIVMRYICTPPRPPLPMLPTTHRSLAQAYLYLNNRAKSAEHLKAALSIDIQLHGEDNRTELIDEYTRLSSVTLDDEEKQKYAEKATRLLERFYTPSPALSGTIAMIKSAVAPVCPLPRIIESEG